jgi:SPP1 family predicted phage head-tail adaptor
MKNTSVISRLIHKITFLVNTEQSEIKQAKWEPSFETFAEIKPVCDNRFTALENMQFGNVITEEYFLFKVRFINKINKNMRISFHDKIYEIKRIVDEDARGRMMNIIALEI